MKIKDIEKSLKKESDSIVVPDIYSSVKATPINRLLTGETPVQAFKKQLAVRLLVFTLIILIVAFVSFAAMALTEPVASMGPDAYISLNVSDGTRFGFVIDATGYVKVCVKEKDVGTAVYQKVDEISGNELKQAINTVYSPNSSDEIKIYALCSKSDLASYWCNEATNDILSMCIGGKSINQISAWPNRESEMINYINTKMNDDSKVSATSSADEIIAAYLSLF